MSLESFREELGFDSGQGQVRASGVEEDLLFAARADDHHLSEINAMRVA